MFRDLHEGIVELFAEAGQLAPRGERFDGAQVLDRGPKRREQVRQAVAAWRARQTPGELRRRRREE